MKLLGVIGGIGPESTVDYYQTIVGLYRARKPDGSYPALVINSVDMQRLRNAFEAGDLPAIVNYMLPELHRLHRAGAEFGLLAANTPHLVFEDLQRQSPIPLISIVAVTRGAAKARGMKRVALFGTRFTMTADVSGRFLKGGHRRSDPGARGPGLHPRKIPGRTGERHFSSRYARRFAGDRRSHGAAERHRWRDFGRDRVAAHFARAGAWRDTVSEHDKDSLRGCGGADVFVRR